MARSVWKQTQCGDGLVTDAERFAHFESEFAVREMESTCAFGRMKTYVLLFYRILIPPDVPGIIRPKIAFVQSLL